MTVFTTPDLAEPALVAEMRNASQGEESKKLHHKLRKGVRCRGDPPGILVGEPGCYPFACQESKGDPRVSRAGCEQEEEGGGVPDGELVARRREDHGHGDGIAAHLKAHGKEDWMADLILAKVDGRQSHILPMMPNVSRRTTPRWTRTTLKSVTTSDEMANVIKMRQASGHSIDVSLPLLSCGRSCQLMGRTSPKLYEVSASDVIAACGC